MILIVIQGIKQRVRYRISGNDWPIGVAGYLEVAELRDELEFEEKVLLSWRAGAFELVGNLQRDAGRDLRARPQRDRGPRGLDARRTLGTYLRVDETDVAVGDPYGRVWVRLIAGIGL